MLPFHFVCDCTCLEVVSISLPGSNKCCIKSVSGVLGKLSCVFHKNSSCEYQIFILVIRFTKKWIANLQVRIAGSSHGIFNGLMTLRQLLRKGEDGERRVPQVKIRYLVSGRCPKNDGFPLGNY